MIMTGPAIGLDAVADRAHPVRRRVAGDARHRRRNVRRAARALDTGRVAALGELDASMLAVAELRGADKYDGDDRDERNGASQCATNPGLHAFLLPVRCQVPASTATSAARPLDLAVRAWWWRPILRASLAYTW